jgi:hypothetical protein
MPRNVTGMLGLPAAHLAARSIDGYDWRMISLGATDAQDRVAYYAVKLHRVADW